MDVQHPNRLMAEKSPYLLQHAANPVDWYPWGEEAFQKAEHENKPVFLSIGYSTCHWCHVMAHESFEDDEVAGMLNQHFVSIKVDREERPDVDSIYMSVCQALTGQGGWPLTVVMTPDKRPFFAGTYFPKTKKYGRIGLMELLERLNYEWQHNREKVESTGSQIVEAVAAQYRAKDGQGTFSKAFLTAAFESFLQQFDAEYGGFGDAPKFPTPHNLSFLLRYHRFTGNPEALEMVTRTIDTMREGGIWDHVGYGFARYSVDRRWLIPHFEKMLYDNALLGILYLEAYQVTGKQAYADTAEQIFTYVEREMADKAGGFYSALDADSEGEEGKFYAWDADEVRAVLSKTLDEATVALFCEYYNITDYGNFEGRNILHTIHRDDNDFCEDKGVTADELRRTLEKCRQLLFEVRERRVHPHKDDKILTGWNGLMIAALAKAGQVLGETKYVDRAVKAAEFILTEMRRQDGRLLARYRDGDAAILGYLDDYAFLSWGLIELYEAGFDERYLQEAVKLSSQMLELFRDPADGGLFLSGYDSEEVIARPKEVYDGALPSGNSVAAHNLFRLARLTNHAEFESAAEDCLSAFANQVKRYPSGFTHYLMALMYAVLPSREVVLVGQSANDNLNQMRRLVQSRFLPNTVWLVQHVDERSEKGRGDDELLAFLDDYQMVNHQAAAYVCEQFACQAPTTDIGILTEQLNFHVVEE
ncbi:thioredoxin domain-containing protein [Alicyclobacillus ferrooxydans]|uniref:Thioredoxin n=1 Tax=Alicyclobacillus ferrooxydans TaxID=471514 RepID=A0A0P9EKM6_9BACL|nr:thioredoxin domain-containing protein [Alicyclobacillus ferrooxydans]KPV43698.1 thioredoxin [Alicyclobacillus ferrooxydans]